MSPKHPKRTSVNLCGSALTSTHPEELPALLDHVRQAVGGSQVLVQVPLIRLPQSLLSVHHPAPHR